MNHETGFENVTDQEQSFFSRVSSYLNGTLHISNVRTLDFFIKLKNFRQKNEANEKSTFHSSKV